jgi:hypothetical protein
MGNFIETGVSSLPNPSAGDKRCYRYAADNFIIYILHLIIGKVIKKEEVERTGSIYG